MESKIKIYKVNKVKNASLYLGLFIVISSTLIWSGIKFFEKPEAESLTQEYTEYKIGTGSIESKIKMNSTAEWSESGEIYNNARGILTSVKLNENYTYKSGDILYSVNLKPVRLIEGSIPAFRSMKMDDVGDDIRALQLFLREQGLYQGRSDGSFGPGTEAAVKAWQKESGYPETGQIDLGEIVFIDTLPARLSLDIQTMKVGQSLVGGESIANILSAQPIFEIPVSNQHAAIVDKGTKVNISGPDGEWEARVSGKHVSKDKEDESTLELESLSGESICGNCTEITVGEKSLYPASIVIQPRLEGLVAPTAAIFLDEKSNNYVVDNSGQDIPIKILGSANGKSIISGLPEGTVIRLHSERQNGNTDH